MGHPGTRPQSHGLFSSGRSDSKGSRGYEGTPDRLNTANIWHFSPLGMNKPFPNRIVTEEELLQHVQDCNDRNKTVVITNGCFDLLHPGHIAYLEQARALGDRLIVAVNDDDSVTRLKGKNRPINSVYNRMAVLAGLRSVDWVVSFSEDTPARLIGAVKPQVLVKGGDYTVDQIAGANFVIKEGGSVKILDFIEGCSTSSIFKTIQANQITKD